YASRRRHTISKRDWSSDVCSSDLLEHLTHVGEVRQRGFMVGIELVQDKGTREAFSSDERMGYEVTLEMRRRGLLSRPMGDVLVFMPQLCSTETELKDTIEIIVAAIHYTKEEQN